MSDEKEVEKNYHKILRQYPTTNSFLDQKRIVCFEKLPSRWRGENLILKIECMDGFYVFKQINEEKDGEIERAKKLKQRYPKLLPEIFLSEGNSYLMSYVNGPSFFALSKKDKVKLMLNAGIFLRDSYFPLEKETADLKKKMKNSFCTYRMKAKEFFSEDEFHISDFEMFGNVPVQLSHGDLNAANLLYGSEIKAIDPAEKGFSDVAKDIGRYCASCFFNNYDYFGNHKKHSLEIADAFLGSFHLNGFEERVKYFIGESFLSFLRFKTESTPKSTLKKLSMNLLTKKGKIISLLEEAL